jgi:hypothetical protein
MKSKTSFGVVLVLILSFFSVSFTVGSLQNKEEIQSVKLNTTPTLANSAVPMETAAAGNPPQQKIEFEHMVLNESFDNNNNSWQIGEVDDIYWKGTRKVEGGTFSWDGVSVGAMLYAYDFPNRADLPKQTANVQVSTKFKLNDPKLYGNIGLMIRENETESWNNYYFFSLETSGKSFSVLRSSNDDYKYLVWQQEIPAVDLSKWNELAVEAVGGHFRLMLNGDQIGEVDDDALASGVNGIMVSWDEKDQPIKIQFDDFILREAGNVPANLIVQSPSATPEEQKESSSATPEKEKATKGPHSWSLPLYPDAVYKISDLEGDASMDTLVERQTRNLAIEPPYSYEFYYLPTVRSYDEVRAFYKKEVLKLGYSPAADLQGESGIYLLTFVNKSSSPQKKITIQYWSSSANVMIIYKNP